MMMPSMELPVAGSWRPASVAGGTVAGGSVTGGAAGGEATEAVNATVASSLTVSVVSSLSRTTTVAVFECGALPSVPLTSSV